MIQKYCFYAKLRTNLNFFGARDATVGTYLMSIIIYKTYKL